MSRADFSSNGVDHALHAGVNGAAAGTSEPLPCIDIADLDALDLPEVQFLVDYLLPEVGLVLFSGDSGSCKTALMMHVGIALALGEPVGGRFPTAPGAGPVIYLNGELDPALLRATARQAAAGFGTTIAQLPRGRFKFEGEDGRSTLHFRSDFTDTAERAQFAAMIRSVQPSLVVIDTQRALFDLDEKEATQVGPAFTWLSEIATAFRCCIVVLHHLRKMGATNNGERERVSGSRALITGVDVHLQAKASSGRPMRALYVDKTRFPKDNVRAQTEFPVESVFEAPSSDGGVGRSTFIIAGPTIADAAIESESSHERDMLARFDREPLLTRDDLGAGRQGPGTQKRAFTALDQRRLIVKSGQKRGRSDLWKRADARDDELFRDQVGHEVGQPTGPLRAESAQTPVAQGLEVGQRSGPRSGPSRPRDRSDDRDAPAAPRAGAPASHHGERSGPSGPNPLGWPTSRGPLREGVPAADDDEDFWV